MLINYYYYYCVGGKERIRHSRNEKMWGKEVGNRFTGSHKRDIILLTLYGRTFDLYWNVIYAIL